MKKYASRTLQLLGYFHYIFAPLYLAYIAVVFDIRVESMLAIFISPLFWCILLLSVCIGYGLTEMKKWVWWILILFYSMISFLHIVVAYEYAESHYPILAVALSVVLSWLLFLKIASEIRVPYFLPRISWWEINPRYSIQVPVSVARSSGEDVDGEILDISPKGCFIKENGHFNEEEFVELKFNVLGYAVTCKGVVVWRAQSGVTHPKGIGVIFREIDRDQRRRLRIAVRRLNRLLKISRAPRAEKKVGRFKNKFEKLFPQEKNKITDQKESG